MQKPHQNAGGAVYRVAFTQLKSTVNLHSSHVVPIESQLELSILSLFLLCVSDLTQSFLAISCLFFPRNSRPSYLS